MNYFYIPVYNIKKNMYSQCYDGLSAAGCHTKNNDENYQHTEYWYDGTEISSIKLSHSQIAQDYGHIHLHLDVLKAFSPLVTRSDMPSRTPQGRYFL